ncbi:MAG TPA: methyltransferase domain-containing protein [Sumerlaeia bacterium]|nr:methyltransferase domain-containing protein [Sumerlaeia bacterium]
MKGNSVAVLPAKKPKADDSPQRTLGPLSDLERHLPTDWWRTLFNSLYLKTDGDVVENPENTRQEVDMAIRLAALEPNDRILDLCCGQGRHSLELARRGFAHVMGIDRSRYLIRQARKRAKAEGLKVAFHEGDARKLRGSKSSFHCVMLLGNSFGYFEQQADDEAVLKNILQLLARQGILIVDVVDGEWMREHFEPRSWEWIDGNHFVCRERALAKDERRIVTREVITHAEKGVIADQFYAERLYTGEQLVRLLEKVGYEMVRMQEALQTASTRGQDLGMMAHRLILTAQAPVRTAKVSPEAEPFPKVTVLLGDPSLPDRVKRGGQFNADDFDTVQRMKNALAELAGFEFTYVDNHQNLLRTLASNPPDFALNLCDEGYRNDPFMELHVPAVLELLGVPYSGAGPACLGLCYNKNLVSRIAQSVDLPVPMESYIGADDTVATLPSAFPALVKPNFGDSSMGITKNAVVHSADELFSYVEWLRNTFGSCAILIQEFLTGPEYSIGIVGNPGLTYTVFPPLEVDYSALDPDLPAILGYESKWVPDSPYWSQISYKQANIDDETRRQMQDYSNVLFERLGCRDYARFDFRTDAEGTIKLLEVNPNPGWCWDGKLNMMASFRGLRYADLLLIILKAAQERVASQQRTG